MTLKRSLFLLPLVLAGCAVGPDYERPAVETSANFKEQVALAGAGWRPAAPRDDIDRGTWWAAFADPTLDQLERRVEISNQSLRASEAAYRQSLALVDESSSQLFPQITAQGTADRSGRGRGTATTTTTTGSGRTSTTYGASAGATWAPDLWGRIRRTIESDEASAQASAADLASARLSLQSQLATAYFQLRVQDSVQSLLDATVDAFARSLQIAQNQYDAGIVAKSDLAQAQAQLEQTRAQAVASRQTRAQLEHAIAVLVGQAPANFSLPPVKDLTAIQFNRLVPAPPAALPSTLLERRPDVAGAERRVAAANAEIGVAVAAYYPDLTLSASYGFSGSPISKLFQAPNAVWSLGANLAATLFDAGARGARVDAARAAYDQQVANYRQTVLTAFQQVEDQLVAVNLLQQQSEIQARAVAAAREAERSLINQYRAGRVSFTEVATAQASALSAEQSALGIARERLLAQVSLVQALGGGWQPGDVVTVGK